MKLAKIMLTGTMLFVPALAMGIAQQDPAQPNQLQQEQVVTQPGMSKDFVGTIAEVRDDSFSVKSDADQSVMWFSITPELKASYAAELVTGNHVRVSATAGDSPDRMVASSLTAEVVDTEADLDVDLDTDTDIDADIDVDEDSATATLDTDTEFEDNEAEIDSDVEIADTDTDSSLREDDTTYDDDADDELPRTASSLPSIGALGLLALLGAAAVAFLRKF